MATVELQLRPTAKIVPIVSRFVAVLFEELLADGEAASRLALAAHELVENAVKFASEGAATIRLSAEPGHGGTRIGVRTVNRAGARDRAALEPLVAALRRSPAPSQRYLELMRDSARRSDGSGLGLARVVVEAGMELECAIRGDEVTLSAAAIVSASAAERAPLTSPAPGLASSMVHEDGALMLRLAGTADAAAVGALDELLPRAHAEALRFGLDEIVVDLAGVELMSSSCLRCFVIWISDVAELPAAQQYRIRLRSNPAHLWQRQSLHALKTFADELVAIES